MKKITTILTLCAAIYAVGMNQRLQACLNGEAPNPAMMFVIVTDALRAEDIDDLHGNVFRKLCEIYRKLDPGKLISFIRETFNFSAEADDNVKAIERIISIILNNAEQATEIRDNMLEMMHRENIADSIEQFKLPIQHWATFGEFIEYKGEECKNDKLKSDYNRYFIQMNNLAAATEKEFIELPYRSYSKSVRDFASAIIRAQHLFYRPVLDDLQRGDPALYPKVAEVQKTFGDIEERMKLFAIDLLSIQ